MKERSPAYQHYPSDIQSDPRYRGLSQRDGSRGAYRDLMDFVWIEKELPLDDTLLASLVNLTEGEWGEIKARILALFVETDHGTIRHKRLDAERRKQANYREHQIKAGKASGKARRKNMKTKKKRTPVQLGTNRTATETNSSVFSLLSSTSVKETDTSENTFSVEGLVTLWNEAAQTFGLPQCKRVTESRRRAATARIAEHPKMGEWIDVMKSIGRSDFCRGATGWRANFDFLVRPDSFTKIIEGQYENSEHGSKKTAGNARALQKFMDGERGE